VNEINPQEIKKEPGDDTDFPTSLQHNTVSFFLHGVYLLSIGCAQTSFLTGANYKKEEKEKGSHNTINQLTPFLVSD
jgi:hypothetical protein